MKSKERQGSLQRKRARRFAALRVHVLPSGFISCTRGAFPKLLQWLALGVRVGKNMAKQWPFFKMVLEW